MEIRENAEHYLHDVRYRTKIMLYVSFSINLAYAVVLLILGIWDNNSWDIVLALYYTVLALMRFVLLRTARSADFGVFIEGEYRIYRFVGAVLLFLNLVLSVMVAAYFRREVTYDYSVPLLVAMAAFSFFKIIAATLAVIRSPKQHSPLYSAAKNVSLAAAAVSLLSFEEAMLESLSEDIAFRDRTIGISGLLLSLLLIVLSVYMIVRASLALKKQHGSTL